VVVSFSDIDGENKEQGENHQHVSSTMAGILECNSHKIKISDFLNFVISGLTIWMSIPYLAI
jgi:hypothetical protein